MREGEQPRTRTRTRNRARDSIRERRVGGIRSNRLSSGERIRETRLIDEINSDVDMRVMKPSKRTLNPKALTTSFLILLAIHSRAAVLVTPIIARSRFYFLRRTLSLGARRRGYTCAPKGARIV
jgi:hypothetical protein